MFHDEFRQATFETQEDGHLFHKILRKKLAQTEPHDDKESVDELAAHVRETILHEAKKMKNQREVEEEGKTSLSDDFLICQKMKMN